MSQNKDLFKIESMYDYDFDVLGIRVTHDYDYRTSIEMEEGIILDFDINNVPVALEILDASKVFKVPKSSLMNPYLIKMEVNINEKSIHLKTILELIIHHKKEDCPVESFTSNNTDIPSINRSLATV